METLPSQLSILTLSNTVLMPGAFLPVIVSHPLQKLAIDSALKQDRWIGILQEQSEGKFYQVGCAGQISSFTQLEQEKYLIVVTGQKRFSYIDHVHIPPLLTDILYLEEQIEIEDLSLERLKLHLLLESYLEYYEISGNWDEIQSTSSERLITSLTMLCPFSAAEKQALLEKDCMKDRCHMLLAFMEMAVLSKSYTVPLKH